jgi:DNA-binding NarL/FixJ family response regulator
VTYRILVVDDYDPWRRHMCSEIRQHGRWRVAGEAADGTEAVRKAQGLQPDLILLDIGLPALNGLDTARRILAHHPAAKILFVTEERSWEVAEVALATGARGYLVKTDVGSKLLCAMEAVVNGGCFLSAGLSGHFCDARRNGTAPEVRGHQVAIYADASSRLDGYVRFAEAALDAGKAFIVAARNGGTAIQERLQLRGVDVEGAIREGRYQSADQQDLLTKFVIDGRLDEDNVRAAASALVTAAARAARAGHPRVAFCGEVAPALWQQGDVEMALRLECLWTETFSVSDVETLCGYVLNVPRLRGRGYASFQSLCAAHSSLRVH